MSKTRKITTALAWSFFMICTAIWSVQTNAIVSCSCWSSRWPLACCYPETMAVKDNHDECKKWCELKKPGSHASTDPVWGSGCHTDKTHHCKK